MKMLLVAVLATFVCAGVAQGASRAPAIKYHDDVFGPILATQAKKALYTWKVEQRAGGKIRCTGACAGAWPPLLAKGAVPKHLAGIKGTFGTIRRPDGKRQVTFKGFAVYTYAHERPTQVLCDNVDGWFVVRLR
jgi:predicted lipoprotein with Yx(FWY)xxD motif